jgi:spore coat polysaccharide biosynthesis protein SpsF
VTSVGIVQARTGSTRLPRKVLADIAGLPALELLLRRLQRAPLDAIVVATSVLPGDDAVADLATLAGVAVVRGPEDDVLTRYAMALDAHPADEVVRLTGDCPFTDPEIVAGVIEVRRATGADYASNAVIRTFPDGLDVEVMTAATLRAAVDHASGDEREHVTPFVYRRPEQFRLAALVGSAPLGDRRWTLDTIDDLERIRVLAAAVDDAVAASWRDVLVVDGPDPMRDGLVLDAAVVGDEAVVGGPVDDPADRRYVARRAGVIVGHVGVVVTDVGQGVAAVTPLGRASTREELVDALRRRLEGDAQVRSLRFSDR